ncbi:glycosyltransferase family 2 protein [Pseudohalocynthiibacter aestuariivivens]|uniref:Glycosyltransferase family 2 protein n=1 Tax=Pseudohalocynthiibacter aestuariivivens TaxID=1591409 RepID=A0ABV5JJA8_9RHOB|nr:glycosyltransferase family 2 protein [Pseudohalocynthiibacter aestuariivivens]MBS9716765.1 glycosyltransferase [Pseudohalocynthiibacter aestuariivivens]
MMHVKPLERTAVTTRVVPAKNTRLLLGPLLVERGDLKPEDLERALALKKRRGACLRNVLLTHNMVNENNLFLALKEQWRCEIADLENTPPDPELINQVGLITCIRNCIVPWKRIPGGVVYVTANPERFDKFARSLPQQLGTPRMMIAPEHAIHTSLIHQRSDNLVERSEKRVPVTESCRSWNSKALRISLFFLTMALIFGVLLAPSVVFGLFSGWAIITLGLFAILKIAAVVTQLRKSRPAEIANTALYRENTTAILPTVSVLVPLYKEQEIAQQLIHRLKRLTYPKEFLDICLAVEADDDTTQNTLAETSLPRWVRTIIVPKEQVRTKPRALNFALDFCRGSIIGIYDAEDSPDQDQIQKIVRRFSECGPEVACLQGILDYYNARTNWLSRCFTIEYASWFRLVLPGLAKLGFAIPLGGTTLFVRRDALEELGCWNAHNVTEDADLGIRLARHGYKTELVDTVTQEEANCRFVPWIKQRSRWLKGYAMTWAVHMRSPRLLLQQLGWRQFFGFQLVFLGTLSQFVLAPFLWSFSLIMFGLSHPLSEVMSGNLAIFLAALFLFVELTSVCVGIIAVSRKKHSFLKWWVPTLFFYFPLGAIASYKALYEILTRPFYWDKTKHGVFEPTPTKTKT